MVLLADGSVLAAGGLDSNDNPMASSERYNPITNLWSAASSMAMARGTFQMVSL